MTTYPQQHHHHLRPLPTPTTLSQLSLLPNPLNPNHTLPVPPSKECLSSTTTTPPQPPNPTTTASSTFSTPSPRAENPTCPAGAPATPQPSAPASPACAVCRTSLASASASPSQSAGPERERFSFPRTSAVPAALAAVGYGRRRSGSWRLCSSGGLAGKEGEEGGERGEEGGGGGREGKVVFCRRCWVRIWDLWVCWSCGERVARGEERVGYGWCWWHWGCVGCLVCRVCVPTFSFCFCFSSLEEEDGIRGMDSRKSRR